MIKSSTPLKVVCFGDSNTWGYIPGTPGERFDPEVRWPGVMQRELGDGYVVIEEALNGRTTVWDDPMKPDRNGLRQLPFILESHTPIDMVIIALGVNDLKHHFNLKAIDIAMGVRVLADVVIQSCAGCITGSVTRSSPKVLLISPALPVPTPNPIGHKFDGAAERGVGMAGAFHELATEIDCPWIDAEQLVKIPPTDGIHLDAEGHQNLGSAVAKCLLGGALPPRC